MKRIFTFIGFCFFITAMMNSCAKTTKSKLSQEWKVSSYKMTHTETEPLGTSTQTEIRNGKTYSISNTGTNPAFTTIGNINKNTFEINKDGTWSSVLDETSTSTDTMPPIIKQTRSHRLEKSNGYWQFVKKDKASDFKKNERILFNTSQTVVTTDIRTINIYTNSQDTTYNSSTNTTNYAYGSASKTWVVVSSEKDLLKLKFESNETAINPNHVSETIIKKTLVK